MAAYQCIISLIVDGGSNVKEASKFLDLLSKLIQEILEDSDPYIRTNATIFLSKRAPLYMGGRVK